MCEYHQCRNGQRGPTLVGHAHGPASWKGFAYILPRSWQDHGKIVLPCNTAVVCISYGLVGSLVIAHDCGTCTLAF